MVYVCVGCLTFSVVLSSPLKPQPSRLRSSFVLHPLLYFDDGAGASSATANESRMVLNPNQCEIENFVQISFMGKMDFSQFYSGFASVPSTVLCWMEHIVFKQFVPKLFFLIWSNVLHRQIPTSYKKNRFCSKQKRLRFNFSGGIRLWGPVMAFYRPFVVGWQDRVASSWNNVQRQGRGVLNIVQHSWAMRIGYLKTLQSLRFISKPPILHTCSFF